MAARSEKAARGRMRMRARGKREKGVRVCNLPASSQHWSRREERLRRTRRRCAGRAEAASGGHHGDMASMKSSTMTMTRFGSAQEFVQLNTGPTVGASLHNITGDVQALLNAHSFRGGSVTVTSMHTTLAISINENERWLVQADIRRWLREHVARPDEMYLHNDIEVRRLDEPDMPDDEPKNAHAHLQVRLMVLVLLNEGERYG